MSRRRFSTPGFGLPDWDLMFIALNSFGERFSAKAGSAPGFFCCASALPGHDQASHNWRFKETLEFQHDAQMSAVTVRLLGSP